MPAVADVLQTAYTLLLDVFASFGYSVSEPPSILISTGAASAAPIIIRYTLCLPVDAAELSTAKNAQFWKLPGYNCAPSNDSTLSAEYSAVTEAMS
ncbi:hypothetical protein [Faecalicatena contorta]|uniref:hypothetical protein n=1 Tax=Faecalicatena contorta TaxID=39482 RepID=UPI003216ED01